MGLWLLTALLQIQPPQIPPLIDPDEPERPRFTIGAQFAGLAINISEGGHTGLGAGMTASVPAGRRTAIDLRVTHLLPADGLGIYDIRWRRTFKLPRNGKPHYFAAGIAGFYYKDIDYRSGARRERRAVSYPQMLTLAAGWNNRAGRHASLPFEIGVLAHPYGLLVATASLGIAWSPAASR